MSYHDIEIKTEYVTQCRISGCDFQSSHHYSPGEAELSAKEHIGHQESETSNHVVQIMPVILVGRGI